jgi:hypothetical protein
VAVFKSEITLTGIEFPFTGVTVHVAADNPEKLLAVFNFLNKFIKFPVSNFVELVELLFTKFSSL